MSGQSDWRRRRAAGGDQPNRPGQPPTHRRAPGSSGPAPAGPGPRPLGPVSPGTDPDSHDPAPIDFAAADDALDLSEVNFDENFLDALTRDVPVPTRDSAEYQLAEMLSGWRSEIVSTPEPELVSVDDVERAIGTTERASRGRRMVRHLRVVSGAAAIVIVAAAGLTVLSEGSQPGDPLWGIKQVVFAEAASQTQAAHDVRTNLERAEAAIAAGDPAAAAGLLAQAQERMGPMGDTEMRDEMAEWMNRIRVGAGLPTETTDAAPSTGEEQTATTEPTRPDLTSREDEPSSPGESTPPGGGTDEPTTPSEQTSEPPVPSSPPSSSPPAEPSTPSSSTKVTRYPAEFPEIPWTPPPGVDASGRPIG